MTAHGSAFTDPAATADLYRHGGRLASRTAALHQAKTRGRPVAEVIADLALEHLAEPAEVTGADVGCGRGTSSRVLLTRLQPRALLLLDASTAMLAATRTRVEQARAQVMSQGGGTAVAYLRADFHALPLPAASCDLVVAAFCLYHAPDPRPVIAELGRALAPGGTAIMVTKSADSYQALDQPPSPTRPARRPGRRPPITPGSPSAPRRCACRRFSPSATTASTSASSTAATPRSATRSWWPPSWVRRTWRRGRATCTAHG